MESNHLNKFNSMIADKATVISNLSRQYSKASTPEELMWCAIQMQNHANALRVITDTKNTYGSDHHEN